jgi:hypothetical protein
MTCYTEELLDATLEQIIKDVRIGDFTAIHELLQNVEAPYLEGFLNEEVAGELRQKYFGKEEA